MKLHPIPTRRNTEPRRGRLGNVQQQLRNGHQNQNQQQQDEIETPKIQRFTPIRKELCHQFVQETTLEPGSDLWVDELFNFFLSRCQFGITRESIKVWYGRQPTIFRRGAPRAGVRTGTGTGNKSRNGAQTRAMNSNGNSNSNSNFNIPPQSQAAQHQQQQQQFQSFPGSFPFPYQMQMPMQIPIQTPSQNQNQIPPPTPNSVPISAELADYQQKRDDYNNSFDFIRQLHNIFTRQDNLATCLLHLEKIQAICSRANNKLVLPSTYRENTQERLGNLARLMKQEMGHKFPTVDEQDGEFSAQEEEDNPEMVILS